MEREPTAAAVVSADDTGPAAMTSLNGAPARREPGVVGHSRDALGAGAARVLAYAGQTRAASTTRGYAADWRDFAAWCADHDLDPLPAAPQTIALYLDHLLELGRKPSTLGRRLAAIAGAHHEARLPSPTADPFVKAVWSGMRRVHGTAQAGKAPVLPADIRAMVAALPPNLAGRRDRALLLVGFAGAFRRAELVALDVADCAFVAEGLTLTIRRSKTDQQAAGRTVAVLPGRHEATCPVRALRDWLDAARITEGPVFRRVERHGRAVRAVRLSDRAVALIVKRAAAAASLDPARYAGHSLRAGLATAAAIAGAEERHIARQTGHKGVLMLRRYIRDGELFRDNVTGLLDL